MASSRGTERRQEACDAQGVVAVFPLPGVVFFPGTSLPLHVFEPRYRAMVRDVMAGSGLMAVSLLRPGWESRYEGSPPFHEIGTLGRVEDLEPMPDGRFYLRLVGISRVRFGDVVSEAPYRSVRYTTIPEAVPDESDPAIRSGKIGLLTTHGCLLRELSDLEAGGWVFDDSVALADAINGAAAGLPVDPSVRQSLLEENDLARRMERASLLLDEVLERVLRLKALRGGGNRDGGVN